MLNRFKRDSQLVISVRKNLKRKRKGWKETSDSRKKKERTREREREARNREILSPRGDCGELVHWLRSPRGPPPAPPDASGLFVHVATGVHLLIYTYDTCAFSFSDKHLPPLSSRLSYALHSAPYLPLYLTPRSSPLPWSKPSPLDPLSLHTR